MELALPITSQDQKVETNAVHDFKEYKSQSLSKDVKKTVSFYDICHTKSFQFKGRWYSKIFSRKQIYEEENGLLRLKKWFAESKARLLNQFDDDKNANLIMSRMQNRWKNSR